MVYQSLGVGIFFSGILFHVLFGTIITNPTTTTITPVCHDDQVHCAKERKCIIARYKCDYYPDCYHGEDEKNCGSCDFERDSCGYTNRIIGQNIFHRTQPRVQLWNTPSTDHTTNTSTGYFMMTDGVGNTYGSSKTSVLESSKLSITNPQCVLVFNYYYESNESSMIVVGHKQQYQNEYVESLLWKKKLISMRKWQQATIGIGQRPDGWSLFLSADHKYIAIDDLRFENCSYPRANGSCKSNQIKCVDGACIYSTQICDFSKDCLDGVDENVYSCKEYVERCNFEEGYCDWLQDQTDDFEWSRVSGNKILHSPSVDHTTGTSKGSYLVVDASKHEENKASQLLSVVFTRTIPKKCHMKLFYYMDGGYGNSLTVKQHDINNSIVLMELFGTSSGQKEGKLWNNAIVNLKSDRNFHVGIEAKIGRDRKGVIAIDDISFSPDCEPDYTLPPEPSECKENEFRCGDGQCIPCIQKYCVCNFVTECRNKADESNCQSSCDFESGDTCGWQNGDENDINWSVHQGYTPTNETGPPYDHTRRTVEGHYLYVDATQKVETDFPKAYFVSPLYQHGSYNCKFSFWYNMYHAKVVDHNDAILSIKYRCRKDGKKRDTKLWVESKTTDVKWQFATAQLPRCPQQFNIIFEADHYWNTHTDVAIDDWKFECSEKPPVPCNNVTEFQCNVTKQCVPLDSLCDVDANCCDGSDESDELCMRYTKLDFENGFVHGWRQLKNDDFDFTLQHGMTVTTSTGPTADHTFQEDHGTYIYIEATPRLPNETAAISSPTIVATENKTNCMVRFWYNMYGKHMGRLTVYTAIDFGIPHKEVWSLSGNQGKEWKKGIIQLSSEHDFQVIFKASVGSDFLSDLAIDDISFTPGCIFNGSRLPGAPTPPPPNPCAPEFSCGQNGTCISQSKVCDFHINCPNGDDESEAMCGYPQGFENGFGAWKNLENHQQLDFTLHKGPTPTSNTGPTTDATGNKTGNYIYLESSNRPIHSKAVLDSPWYKVAYADCKLKLSYHMYGKNIGNFKILLLINNTAPTDLLDLEGDMGNEWKEINISIGRRQEPFKIQFHASVGDGDKGDIAIDEINFSRCGLLPICNIVDGNYFMCNNDVCIPKSKLCDFVDDCGDLSDEDPGKVCARYIGCNFDNIPCNFTQDYITDDFDWTLNHGETLSINTGPTHDHTFRTTKGNYLYIEASKRRLGDKARIRTFPLEVHGEANCYMKFYYHMFGESLGELNVNIVGGENKTQRILRKTYKGESKFLWREAMIDFSYVSDVFQVEFEGITGQGYQGDIAIDDIIFSPDCLISNQPLLPTNVTCLPNDPKCYNGTIIDCTKDSSDESCQPKAKSGVSDALVIAVLSTLLVLSLITVITVIVVARKRKEEKFHIYSMFDSCGNQELKPRIIPETNGTTTTGAVANLGYINHASDKDLEGSHRVSLKADGQLSRTPSTLSNPLYQEIFHIS